MHKNHTVPPRGEVGTSTSVLKSGASSTAVISEARDFSRFTIGVCFRHRQYARWYRVGLDSNRWKILAVICLAAWLQLGFSDKSTLLGATDGWSRFTIGTANTIEDLQCRFTSTIAIDNVAIPQIGSPCAGCTMQIISQGTPEDRHTHAPSSAHQDMSCNPAGILRAQWSRREAGMADSVCHPT